MSSYPIEKDRKFLTSCFTDGFPIPISQLPSASFFAPERKLSLEHREILKAKIEEEISLGRIRGPFLSPPFSLFISTPMFLVPKPTPGAFRIIHDLTCKGAIDAPNQLIMDEFASVQYATFDAALDLVADIGPGAYMGKQDVKDAFKVLPIKPSDYYLLGFSFDNQFYFETTLPFGCRCSCLYFETFSSFILFEWNRRSSSLLATKYLDDFFCTSKTFDGVLEDWRVLESFAEEIGLPLAVEKKLGPTTCITYLGLEIDSCQGVVRIPEDKTDKINILIKQILSQERISKKTLQRLLGHLNFACRAVPMARPFLRRMFSFLSIFTDSQQRHRLGFEFRQDLVMWKTFFDNGFGPFKIFNRQFITSSTLDLYTDACKSYGCAAVLGNRWLALAWHGLPLNTESWSISALEFLPILFSISTWSDAFKGQKVNFHVDNLALVYIINRKSASDRIMLALLRVFVILCVSIDLEVKATHVPGVQNVAADLLSRGKINEFKRISRNVDYESASIPGSFWSLFSSYFSF